MKAITIFTPTFNRKHTLKKLYDSLIHQENIDNFVWIIVDDGSTDNTKELVTEFMQDNIIDIVYYYQKNLGKQIAHNYAVDKANTSLFICVDSDDYLLPNATKKIESYVYDKNTDVAGWIFLRGNEKFKPLGTDFSNEMLKSANSLTSLYEEFSFKGDTAIVFKTNILKKYKFITINNEKFIGEDYLYRLIEKDYKLIPQREIFYITEYQIDGYTKNVLKHITSSPNNYLMLKDLCISTSITFGYKFKHAILFDAMAIYLGKYNNIFNKKNIILKVFAFPFGIIYYNLKFRRYK